MKIYLMKKENISRLSPEYINEHFPERQKRAEEFRKDDDKKRCLCCGALLYGVLGLCDKDILYTDLGKPVSKNGEKISLSHSGDYSVLAVSDAECGVDIEECASARLSVMKKVFAEREIAFVGEDAERFLIIWTLKESVSKAIGKGLNMSFMSFEVLPILEGGSISVEGKTFFGGFVKYDNHILSYVTEGNEPLTVTEYIP